MSIWPSHEGLMRKFGTHGLNPSTREASRAFEYDFLYYHLKHLRWSIKRPVVWYRSDELEVIQRTMGETVAILSRDYTLGIERASMYASSVH